MALSESGEGDFRVLHGESTTIRTLEDALKVSKVDLNIWEVDRWEIRKWDQGSKNKDKDIAVQELYYVKVVFKRKLKKYISDTFDNLVAKMGEWTPSIFIPNKTNTENNHLLEISLFDTHFGKLAWGEETGIDYDVKIAKNAYYNAVTDLLSLAQNFNIDQILFPIGNDFFHVNNWINTTAKGTPQDVDTRFQRVFEVGCEAVIRAIDACLNVAPVNVLWVPGNHDLETSWYMAMFLDAWYRNIPEVRVNRDPTSRKYVGYGVNLLGFTHGDEEPHRDLPTLMAAERPDLWAQSTFREWHVGHFHKKKETKFLAGDTYNGIGVKILPSLSGTDAWHFKKGYVKTIRAAEAYLLSYKNGYVGHFNANFRGGDV